MFLPFEYDFERRCDHSPECVNFRLILRPFLKLLAKPKHIHTSQKSLTMVIRSLVSDNSTAILHEHDTSARTDPAATKPTANNAKPLPIGNWDDQIHRVMHIFEDELGGDLQGIIRWSDGRTTQHPLTVLYHKCLRKLLDFYEQHLVFKDGVDDNSRDSWEYQVKRVNHILQTGTGGMTCILEWEDGSRKDASLSVVKEKCPSKLLKYYE